MPRTLTGAELLALRLRAQFLSDERATDVAGVLRRTTALQAQLTPAARLAVRSRTAGLTRHDVDAACGEGRAAVRTWAMRATLHMVAATDVRWLTDLLGPILIRAGRRRREELGLDDDTCSRGLDTIAMVLAGSRPLIRAELMEAIGERSVRIDLSSQAPAHLLRHAAFTGLICRGPEAAGDEPTYVLLDEWVPPAPPLERDEALALFARRYLEGHGPASAADFATWSGLPMPDARAAFALIGDECVEFDAAGTPMVALASTDLDPPPSPPRLLGRFDGYLLGYRGRDLILDPRHSRGILEGGMIQAAVVVGGRIVGTWRLEQRGRMHELVVHPFTALPRGSRGGLREEAADIGRFLGIEVALVVRDS